MIYIFSLALIVAGTGFYRRLRVDGFLSSTLDVLIATAFGWIAGLFIGVGARIGMWSIPFFNGAESRFSWGGTFDVILAFSLYGIALGIIYELIFRKLLRDRGFLYGLLITLVTWYPLGKQGVDLLNFTPSFVPTAIFTFLFLGLMFVPFGIALEFLVGRWHKYHDVFS
ncbi:MAG: hypothetical protein ACT4O9_10605 [Blastocatellia bacterium]